MKQGMETNLIDESRNEFSSGKKIEFRVILSLANPKSDMLDRTLTGANLGQTLFIRFIKSISLIGSKPE